MTVSQDAHRQLVTASENSEARSSYLPGIEGIPVAWETTKLKRVATLNMGQSPPSDRYNQDGRGVPFLQGNADFGQEHPTPETYCVQPTMRTTDQDLLLSVRAPVGAVNIADQEYGIGRGLCAISPRQDLVDSRFVYFVLLSVAQPQLQRSSTGSTYDAVSTGDVGRVVLPLPDQKVQRAISQFLRRQTGKIDNLIAKKERLIRLLEEKRTALITQAVTKGLDPDVPMKDSGVEWLETIPEAWEVTRLRRVADVVDCKHRTPTYVDDGFPLVSTTEVQPGVLDLSRCTRFVAEADFNDMTEGRRRPELGDIIYSRNASLGQAALVTTSEDFCMGQDVVLIRSHQFSPSFLNYQLNSPVATRQVEAEGVGSTFSRINVRTIRNLTVVRPPLNEQKSIVAKLEDEIDRIDHIQERTSSAIDLLSEYRSALITAAVTGKIDVRDHAA